MTKTEIETRIKEENLAVESHQKRIKDLEAKLVPEPRHGDVVQAGSSRRLVVQTVDGLAAIASNGSTYCNGTAGVKGMYTPNYLGDTGCYKVLGNIFDGYVWSN